MTKFVDLSAPEAQESLERIIRHAFIEGFRGGNRVAQMEDTGRADRLTDATVYKDWREHGPGALLPGCSGFKAACEVAEQYGG